MESPSTLRDTTPTALTSSSPLSTSMESDSSLPAGLLHNVPADDFTALGLGTSWWPSGWIESLLQSVHLHTGLPWWSTIVVTTLGLRLLFAPTNVYSQRQAVLLRLKQTEMQPLMKRYQSTDCPEERQALMKEIQQCYVSHGLSPGAAFLAPLCSAPIFLSCFFALRHIADKAPQAVQEGGLYWFENLSLPDPYFVLPGLAAITFILTLESGFKNAKATSASSLVTQQSTQTWQWVMRGMVVVGLPVMASFPAALSLYWFSNSLFGYALAESLRSPSVKRWLNFPQEQQQASQEVSQSVKNEQQAARMARQIVKQAKQQPTTEMGFMEGLKFGMQIAEHQQKSQELKKGFPTDDETQDGKNLKRVLGSK